jgi:uncharacterized protein YdhG (YjbR/CyaY superfamily)
MAENSPKDIDEYIARFPPEVQVKLREIRAVIGDAAPQAEETIKYDMPTFVLQGNLVSFAAYKRYISLYPAPSGSEEFNQALAPYRAEKSTIHFPLDQPIPDELIREIVRLRVKDNLERAETKRKKKVG